MKHPRNASTDFHGAITYDIRCTKGLDIRLISRYPVYRFPTRCYGFLSEKHNFSACYFVNMFWELIIFFASEVAVLLP